MDVREQRPGDGAERSGGGAGAKQACGAHTKHGAACRSFALPDGQFCLSHDPERQEAVREARSKGGAAASKMRALEGRRAKLDTPAALMRFTGRLIQNVLDQTTPVDVGVQRGERLSYASLSVRQNNGRHVVSQYRGAQ